MLDENNKHIVKKPRYHVKTKRVNINLPAALYEDLQDMCYKNGINVSHYITTTLINKVRRKPHLYNNAELYDII